MPSLTTAEGYLDLGMLDDAWAETEAVPPVVEEWGHGLKGRIVSAPKLSFNFISKYESKWVW